MGAASSGRRQPGLCEAPGLAISGLATSGLATSGLWGRLIWASSSVSVNWSSNPSPGAGVSLACGGRCVDDGDKREVAGWDRTLEQGGPDPTASSTPGRGGAAAAGGPEDFGRESAHPGTHDWHPR